MKYPVLRLLAGLLVSTALACSGDAVPVNETSPASGDESAPLADPLIRFSEASAQSGLSFRHVSGDPSDKRAIYESNAGGLAWIDADGDGRMDLYLTNSGHHLTGQPPPAERRTSGALFRNEGGGMFREVTASAGLEDWRWGVGVATGDHDNDGDTDLYVVHLGANALWRNNGDGTFTDVAAAAGVADDGPGSTAAFGDMDGDGHLDLYVANYVPVTPDLPLPSNDELCTYRGVPVYCGPKGLPIAPDRLYRNRGDGSFEEVTESSGIGSISPRHSYDVLFSDLDADGDADIYVAADQGPSMLFINDGHGHFSERGIAAGVALGEAGTAQAGMGVAIADWNFDGLPDIVKTNFEGESNNLYRNSATGLFTDRAYASGLGSTIPPMGWGVVFLDADRDGFQDLFFANGHVYPLVETGNLQLDYAQRNLLFAGRPGRPDPLFEDVSGQAGPGLAVRQVSRGVAVSDYDGDGDLDLAVQNLDGTPHLLRNDTITRNAWLAIRTRGTRSNRDGYGARVILTTGDRRDVREVRSSGGYLSASDPTLFFGLGAQPDVRSLEIQWPSGLHESFPVPLLNSRHLLVEGEGTPAGS